MSAEESEDDNSGAMLSDEDDEEEFDRGFNKRGRLEYLDDEDDEDEAQPRPHPLEGKRLGGSAPQPLAGDNFVPYDLNPKGHTLSAVRPEYTHIDGVVHFSQASLIVMLYANNTQGIGFYDKEKHELTTGEIKFDF